MSVDPETGISLSAAQPEAAEGGTEEDDEVLRALLQDVEPRAVRGSQGSSSPHPSVPRRPSSARCPPPRASLEVTASEAAALIASRSATLLDVRQPSEYRLDGHVEGSANVAGFSWEHGFYLPREDFAAVVSEDHQADEPLVLMCAEGSLAKGAAAVLEAAGFKRVSTLDGGLRAWEAAAEEEGAGVPPLVIDEDGEGGLTGAWV
jgi:rhodanese-related sulfurtransferase